MKVVLLAALAALAAAHNRTTIPKTPAMRSMGGELHFSVDNTRFAFKYGSDPKDVVYLDDPSQSTIDAIKLGYSLGAGLDKLKGDVAVLDKLNKFQQQQAGINSDLISKLNQAMKTIDNLSQRLRDVEGKKVPSWAIGFQDELSQVRLASAQTSKQVQTDMAKLTTTLNANVDSKLRSVDQKINNIEGVACVQPREQYAALKHNNCATKKGTRCSVSCDTGKGYKSKSATLTCAPNGDWTGMPKCEMVIGRFPESAGITCRDIKEKEKGSRDGTYWIHAYTNEPFQVYCDMSRDGGGWTLIGNIGSNNGARRDNWDRRAVPVYGLRTTELSQNKLSGGGAWADLGQRKVNAIHKSYHNSILKLHHRGPGHHSNNRWYFRKYDDTHCNSHPYQYKRFDLFRGIRDTWLWGHRGDRRCGYEVGRNNYDSRHHRARNNGGRGGRHAMQWWDHWTIRSNGGKTGDWDDQHWYVSRHGIPGDIYGGCEWAYNFHGGGGSGTYGFCNGGSWSQLWLK